MSDEPTFGSLVRNARLAKRLSLGQLAGEVGRTAASVRRWERDESVPSDEIRERLAEVLDLDADTLHRLAEAGDSEAGTPPTPAPAPPVPVSVPAAPAPPDPFLDGPTEALAVPPPIVPAAPVPGEPAPTGEVEAIGPATLPERIAAWRRILFDPDEPWLGYLRGALTAIAFVVMLVVLVWAVGELSAAIGEFFRSFSGAEEPTALGLIGPLAG